MKPVHVILQNEINRLKIINPDLWNEIKGHFNGMFGLDCCWLSDYLEVPDGVSLREFCASKFGTETAEILYKLSTTTAGLSE